MANKGQQVEVQGMMLYREELRNIRAAEDYELAGRFFYALIDFFIDGEENDHGLNKRDVTMLEIMREKISRDANKVIQKKIEGAISGIQGAIETEYRKNGQVLSKEQAKSLARQEYERRHMAGGTSEVPSLTVPVSVSPSVTTTVAVAEAVAEATTPSLSESVPPTYFETVAGEDCKGEGAKTHENPTKPTETQQNPTKARKTETEAALNQLRIKNNISTSPELVQIVTEYIDEHGSDWFMRELIDPVFVNQLRQRVKAVTQSIEQQAQRQCRRA